MGGYGSGRRKKSSLTTECIAIDTMHFKEHLRTPGIAEGIMHITNSTKKDNCPPGATPGLAYNIECFEGPQTNLDSAARYPVYGKLTLDYQAALGNEKQHCRLWIPLVTTPCNYGSVRWWMIAPCCGARVRVLYIGGYQMYPMCRECKGLHYQSQRASYVERHITYEKHLLSNYGYDWEQHEYHSLKEHYFKITPKYAYKMRKSQLEQDLRIMRLLIRFERMMQKRYIRAMISLKSDEDKRVYLEHIVQQHGRGYALDLITQLRLNIQFERIVMEAADTSLLKNIYSDDTVDTICSELDIPPDDENELQTFKLHMLKSKEQELIQEIDELEREAA